MHDPHRPGSKTDMHAEHKILIFLYFEHSRRAAHKVRYSFVVAKSGRPSISSLHAVIALWLGHESIETTNAYLHANLAMKERALAKVLPVGTPFRRFQANDTLLAFLESL
jgi:integrase